MNSVLVLLPPAIGLIIGLAAGWVIRSRRSINEKAALHSSWREQLELQRSEHARLVELNKHLMEQINGHRRVDKDADMRAAELESALEVVAERHDALRRDIKDIRSELEVTVTQRDQLRDDIARRSSVAEASATALQQRDELIAKLVGDLKAWQQRLPPLIERFRTRNDEALLFKEQLAAAENRIAALDSVLGSEQTRVEPVDREALGDNLDASNEPLAATKDNSDAGRPRRTGLAAGNEDRVAISSAAIGRYESLMDTAELAGLASEIETADDADKTMAAIGEAKTEAPDNLRMIDGIGPAIEDTLNQMGICSFDQIAEISEYEINQLANRLKGFRSRIYREDWIGQARHLRDQKSGSPS
jgi:predicted flap endonuclease-1-like 5' DNA nuclease